VGQVVTGDKEESSDVGACLKHAIDRVKGNTSPGCERFRFLVLMMAHVDVLVHPLVGMKGAMHPVDANFYACKVQEHGSNVPGPAPNLFNGVVGSSQPRLNEEFINGGQQHINEHALL
jgi:hypothetical protein